MKGKTKNRRCILNPLVASLDSHFTFCSTKYCRTACDYPNSSSEVSEKASEREKHISKCLHCSILSLHQTFLHLNQSSEMWHVICGSTVQKPSHKTFSEKGQSTPPAMWGTTLNEVRDVWEYQHTHTHTQSRAGAVWINEKLQSSSGLVPVDRCRHSTAGAHTHTHTHTSDVSGAKTQQ